ncbi:MAG: hypothetical protein IPK58_25695 [Acidobacteria bacterium]|nr:hypothetical protein [Acidobacteriota bacterium]
MENDTGDFNPRREENTGVPPKPVHRRLQGYAFDPSLSTQVDTALINKAIFKIPWEDLRPGPVGEYIEVIDFDPASESFYAPVDLDHKFILASDGLAPSEGNPQFHQQMAYAVAMTTIKNFERALGRKALWSSYRERVTSADGTTSEYPKEYTGRLRIYPHALRQANAYYSPAKKSLLFGYFPAVSSAPGEFLPNGMVFTCLSHDIIAHETTHALLDGMHRRFIESSHRDTLAFHEAFADIVALFQHFRFPKCSSIRSRGPGGVSRPKIFSANLRNNSDAPSAITERSETSSGLTMKKTTSGSRISPNPKSTTSQGNRICGARYSSPQSLRLFCAYTSCVSAICFGSRPEVREFFLTAS